MGELFTKSMWREVGKDLRGSSSKWWKTNQSAIVGLGKEEMRAIAYALKSGNSKRAQMEILSRLDPKVQSDWDVWVSYRDGTTKRLKAAARRRKKMLDALEELGKRLARLIGKAVLAALL